MIHWPGFQRQRKCGDALRENLKGWGVPQLDLRKLLPPAGEVHMGVVKTGENAAAVHVQDVRFRPAKFVLQ